MKVCVIAGSHRKASQSKKVAHVVAAKAKKAGHEADILDLAGNPLPLWDESAWSDERWQGGVFEPYREKLTAADSFVLVTPEWSGMVPAALKNFLLLVNKEMADKPAMIVSISASHGGSYPVSELRVASAKNTRIIYTPDHVIVRHCEKMLNDAEKPADDTDAFIHKRMDYGLKTLGAYSKGLKLVRETKVFDHQQFPFGM